MDQKIAQLNIEHFQQLLKTETDEAKRAILKRLLAEEESKLRLLRSQEPTKGKT